MSKAQAGNPRAAANSGAPATRAPGRSGRRLIVPAADGFRGLAVVSVMLYHISYASGRPPLHSVILRDLSVAGYVMPDFFFVISGFLLFLPVVLSGTFGSVKTYALRRAARILPAYYLAIVVTGLVDKAVVTNPLRDYPLWHPLGLLSLLLHLTFLQHSVGLALKLSEGFNVNGAIWTLSIEAVFYVLLPIIAVRYARHPFLGLAGALIIAAAWRHASLHLQIPLPHLAGLTSKTFDRGFLVTQFPTYAAAFAAGMTTAWIFVKLRRASFTVPAWVIVPVQAVAAVLILRGMIEGAAGDIAGTSNPYAHWTTTTMPMLFFAVLLLTTAMAPLWAQVLVRNKLARKIGDISYGMYLWHLLFVGFALTTLHWAPNATNGDWLRMAAFTFTGAILCGAASYRWIEQPFIRWAKRRSAAVPQGGAGGLRPTSGIEAGGLETAPAGTSA